MSGGQQAESARPSPIKGKVKDESVWRADWWDVYPLTEQAKRPIAWAHGCAVFFAHPSLPLVICRILSTGRQFLIATSLASGYQPPTVITTSPDGSWLFAYFPSNDDDGIGCIWKRGATIEAWNLREHWPFPRGAGAVGTAWLGVAGRPWKLNSNGTLDRFPPSGPITPALNPSLLVVTEAMQVNVYYLRPFSAGFKVMSCTLTQPNMTHEGHASEARSLPLISGHSRMCVRAAIGSFPNESTVIVATRCRTYPSDSTKATANSSLDFTAPTDANEHHLFAVSSGGRTDWEFWSEESMIDFCEVNLKYDGAVLHLFTLPMGSIHHPSSHLISLDFVDTQLEARLAAPITGSSPHKDGSKPAGKSFSAYVAAAFLDFTEYSSMGKSDLLAISLTRSSQPVRAGQSPWTIQKLATRDFPSRTLTSIIAHAPLETALKPCLYAVLYNREGIASKPKHKQTAMGSISALNLVDLSDDPEWDSSTIYISAADAGTDFSLDAAVSPNGVLACLSYSQHIAVQSLPRRKSSQDVSNALSLPLAVAIKSKKPINDISHVLRHLSMSRSDTANLLCKTLGILVAGSQRGVTEAEAMGLVQASVELYGMQLEFCKNLREKELFTRLRRVMVELCSMAAVRSSFEGCQDDGSYDLEAVWQLTNLSSWVVEFLENLMKECLLVVQAVELNEPEDSMVKKESADHLSISEAASEKLTKISHLLNEPIWLHLVHPLALSNMCTTLAHVIGFYNHVVNLTAKAEDAQIARDVLVDAVQCSGIDLKLLHFLFSECLTEINKQPAGEGTQMLAEGRTLPKLHDQLYQMIQKLAASSVADKSRLFIKPSDLVDGLTQLSLTKAPVRERDVVTNSVLITDEPAMTCIRCGGRSLANGNGIMGSHRSLRWGSWEKKWQTRCICGGEWSLDAIAKAMYKQ